MEQLYNKYWWLTPLCIFLIWRVGLEVAGRLFFDPSISSPWTQLPHPPLWVRWDSGWYLSIVEHGYSLRADVMSNVTFFPLFPLFWKILSILLPLSLTTIGLLISQSAAGLGFIFFFRLIQERYGHPFALKSLVALAVFPSSFFLISAYSEALFFLLAVLFFWCLQKNRLVTAAILAGLLSAARPVGILLWPTLLVWIAHKKLFTPLAIWQKIIAVAAPPLGLILFSVYLWGTVGNPLAWLHGQTAAGRELLSPLSLLFAYSKNIITRENFWLRHLGELAAFIFVTLNLRRLYKLEPMYALYVGLSLLPALFSNTLTSLQRFCLLIIPLFIVIAHYKKVAYTIYILVSLPLLLYSISQFVNWHWAG